MEAEIYRLKDRVGRLETILLGADCKSTTSPSSVRSPNKKEQQQHYNVSLTNQQQAKQQLKRNIIHLFELILILIKGFNLPLNPYC